jgi:hypothetical protein
MLSGRVLVTGGFSDVSGFLRSAELYDPAHGTWSDTTSLGIAREREQHTATVLPNGKVLVAGGEGSSGPLSSAQLYNPETQSWSDTGDLVIARRSHTATLLPSGKVLVAGGVGSGFSYLNSAELFDPAGNNGMGSWSSIGSLQTARDFHTATLLPSGEVLVAGGYGSGTVPLNSAEFFDPAMGSWSSTGSLGTARDIHTATLLSSGKVLVAGGANLSSGTLSSAELYDPVTGSWSSTGSLGTARYLHTATLLPSSKVLVAGGGNPSFLSSAELYDPGTGTWSSTGSLGTARGYHTATLLPSGKVLVAGGSNAGSHLSSAELYDPATGSWSSTGTLATAPGLHTATLLSSGKVLVAGGFDGSSYFSSAQLYDPATGSWSSTGSLVAARRSHTATLLPSGKVLVAGGYNGSYLSSAELYDPATGSWSNTGSLATARGQHTARLLPSGKVLVAGGGNPSFLSSAELYDPATGSWSSTGSLGTPRGRHTATLLSSGKVLVAGGAMGFQLSSSELYDPGLGFNPIWRPLLTTVSPSILPDGSALTASGSVFKGISEASGGNGAQNSSSNYPLVQLLSLANEQTLFLPVDAMTGWSDYDFISTPITLMTTSSSGFPIGHALVTVFTNGIPSQSRFVVGATPTPGAQLGNISTRAFVQTGDNVMIGGFIVQGTTPKRVIIRAIGPELIQYGVPNALADPKLELHNGAGALIASNNNWHTTIIGGIITDDQVQEIQNSGHAPGDPRESAIIADLPAGNYTAIVRGVNNTTGVALVEVYDLDTGSSSILGNISTRSFVQTGDNVMIGGFIVQGSGPKRVIIRAIGPELSQYGVPDPLQDPTLELHNGTGALIASNDNWQHTIIGGIITAGQVSAIRASGHAPGAPSESAIIANLPPGNYTAIVRGVSNTTGVALVEAYDLD